MMQQHFRHILYLILAVSCCTLTTSCEDPISLDIPENPPLLVVNGRVTDAEPAFVYLTTTAPYFLQDVTPRVTNAEVLLYEDEELIGLMIPSDTAPGRYELNYTGTVGKSYHLKITIPTNNSASLEPGIYHTLPERLNRIFELDSIFLEFQPPRPPFPGGFIPAIAFKEPEGPGDIYQVRRWKNDTIFRNVFFTINDEFADGFHFGNPPIPPVRLGTLLEPGDTFWIEITSITARYDQYLRVLLDQTFRSAGVFAPPAAPVYGNVFYADGRNALGYFSASAIRYAGIRRPD
ncbi:DUF4249 family protein [Schleiferia thermophila]|nr:DUF4249 family protein [Schleiferia thermophila]GCD80484.1 hypothetical protein JCM30197_17310 [Schleiferia thermophila]